MNIDLKEIINPNTPLLTLEEYVKYWDYWHYVWQSIYYTNSFKKNKSILGWSLPHFFCNANKTIKSFQCSPMPYTGNVKLLEFENIHLSIHPIFNEKNFNKHLFLNNQPFHEFSFHAQLSSFNFYIIPWQSFHYHTDIAEYLYDTKYLKTEPHLVENKVLIPMLNNNSSIGANKVIYTEGNYINSLLLVNNFQNISVLEDYEKEFVIENGIKYKVFNVFFNEIKSVVYCKCF